MDYRKLKLYFGTIRYVKPKQLYHQVYYRLTQKRARNRTYTISPTSKIIDFKIFNQQYTSFEIEKSFTFLNFIHAFQEIEWNYSKFGKLWAYNLNYFDFLNQEKISKETGLQLIHDFCSKSASHKDGYEPYPISLRSINWVKFLSRYEIKDNRINLQLWQDLQRLNKQLEYHILANHLFENGFGLLFGAFFFQDEKLYGAAKKIILSQLKEQILPDGAHYELTPMYHQIILCRILDSYQVVTLNAWKNHEMSNELKDAASLMLGWMMRLQFSNGDLPLVNDSTLDIAPTPEQLLAYANQMGIVPTTIQFNNSGYRKFSKDNIELLFDCGQIAPSYQPGHSHADSLQILVYKNSRPVLVDTGISTYEKNERRQLERSTSSHNTLTVNRENSSEVWSGFRVGRRARVHIVNEDESSILASHDGYRRLGIIHHRSINLLSQGIIVKDTMKGSTTDKIVEGHLHFHPDRIIEIHENSILVDGMHFLQFTGLVQLKMEDYQFCLGFNKLVKANKVVYHFSDEVSFLINH